MGNFFPAKAITGILSGHPDSLMSPPQNKFDEDTNLHFSPEAKAPDNTCSIFANPKIISYKHKERRTYREELACQQQSVLLIWRRVSGSSPKPHMAMKHAHWALERGVLKLHALPFENDKRLAGMAASWRAGKQDSHCGFTLYCFVGLLVAPTAHTSFVESKLCFSFNIVGRPRRAVLFNPSGCRRTPRRGRCFFGSLGVLVNPPARRCCFGSLGVLVNPPTRRCCFGSLGVLVNPPARRCCFGSLIEPPGEAVLFWILGGIGEPPGEVGCPPDSGFA